MVRRSDDADRFGGIPINNVWLLLFYASGLYHGTHDERFDEEAAPDELLDLAARILSDQVEKRLRRGLVHGLETRREDLHRVRGRIDPLRTIRLRLLERGQVACRFEAFTLDTPRLRLVRAGLEACARLVRDQPLAKRCLSLSTLLGALGIKATAPPRRSRECFFFGRRDAEERILVSAANLVLDLALPLEETGDLALPAPAGDEHWIRKLFEKAVGGFYTANLPRPDWTVRAGVRLHWQVASCTEGMRRILPSMLTDVVLEHPSSNRRIVVDTKFTAILKPGRHLNETLSSAHLYQMYAYLRSQDGTGAPLFENASGLLLHPATDRTVDEIVVIQGKSIRFSTVNLAERPCEIKLRLLSLCDAWRMTPSSQTSPVE